MIFVTSGSMLPFDRLFKIIDDAVASGLIQEEVFDQIGDGNYEPKNFKYVRYLEKGEFDQYINSASLVIGHAGIGVIIQALSSNTPLLVLAREARLGEHVNDHQISTANKFEELGHILTFNEQTLGERLEQAKDFKPSPRKPNVEAVSREIGQFLSSLM